MTNIEKYLQARDEVSFKYNKAGAKIWYRAHANIETGVINTGKANGWSCDHDIKINRFQAALILEKYGLTIEQFITAEKEFYATRYPEETDINEADPDDYAVTEDALEVAVNAEIQNANNAKINDLKWEIRYTEGSINDLDKNHIAHFPNDQSLQERRAELVNELDNLNSQLADLLPTEPNTNSEYKYYLQSRRPIAGAVPNGYISATQGEMKVHSLRSDGSISVVPRKVVFGVVVYDHPLSDQQIINYDLHVDPLNPKVEPDTTELSDTETDNTPQVDPIIIERETARNEYDQLNAARNVIEKDCERFERLRDRCKSGSPKRKEYNQLLADLDPIIRAFGERFCKVQDRYNNSLTLRTDEEKAATQKAIDEHNADLDARGIKYFATVYYYPNGIEGEDMSTFEKDCTSLDEANAFVSQEDIDGVYVGGIYDAGWQITDRNHNLIADHITGISSTTEDDDFQSKLAELQDEYDVAIIENKKAIDATKAAEKALQAARELEQIAAGKRIATGNAIYNFGSAKAAELRNKLLPVENFNRSQMFITNQFDCKRAVYLETIYIEFYDYKFSIIADNNYGTCTLGEYDTPAQVEKVIGMFKAAIAGGDKEFIFPTVDELTALPVSRNNIKIEKEVRRKTG